MKKIITFTLASFVAVSCYAQSDEQTKRFLSFDDFSGGLASHISEYATPLNSCQQVNNLRFDGEYGSLSKRPPLSEYGDTGGTSVNGIYRLYRSDGVERLITATGTVLQVGTDATGAFSSIQTGLTDGARWAFATYQDNAIMASLNDNTLKYDGLITTGTTDGDRTAGYLCAELGAPYAEINTGTTLDASSWYQYKVLFLDGTSNIYYHSNSRSNKILTGASDYDITITDIPLGKTGITERQIYRTEGQASAAALDTATFKLVTVISDNSTQTYDDAIADASLGVEWSTTGSNNITPLTGSVVNIHSERLFVGENSDDPSYLFWSDERNPEWFDRQDFYPIRPDDGDRITFIETLFGKLVVGKTNTIQYFYTDGSDLSWYASDPFSYVGCPAGMSAASTPSGIYYLGRYGLYNFTGQYSQLISDKVSDKISDIKQANYDECFGIYWNNQYLLAYTSDASGVGYNNRVLIYDTKREAYTIDTKNINCMDALESGNDYGYLYYGSSNDGYVTSDGSSEQLLLVKTKSELDDGTFDDTDTFGTETVPYLELAWNLSIDGVDGTIYDLTIDGFADVFPEAIIDRPDDYGYWQSPIYEINANSMNKLYWNEDLNSYGDVTARIKLASTSGGIAAATWSENYTTPTGSDISGLTANNFMQISFDLSTSNIIYTPKLEHDNDFVWKMSYSLSQSPHETEIEGLWRSGWVGVKGYAITIRRIRVFYEADEGTLSFDFSNNDGDQQIQFDIDLAQEPIFTDALGGTYYGYENNKIYTYYPPLDSKGELWRLKIYDTGITDWKVKRVEIMYDGEELYI